MKYRTFRIWLLVSLTPLFAAVIIRMIWEGVVNPFTGTLTLVTLAVLGFLGAYALLVYLAIKPDLATLKSLPVGIGLSLLATGGFIGGILHFIRFIPSPQASAPLSVVLAAFLVLAGAGGYSMVLWFTWSIWKDKQKQR